MNNTELVQSYRQQIGNVVNQANLQLFWNMYNRYGQRGLRCAAPGHSSSSWGPLTTTACERRPMGRQHTLPFVDAQLVKPPGRLTHPMKGRGGAGLQTLVPGLVHSFSPLGHCHQQQWGMRATSLTPNIPEPKR